MLLFFYLRDWAPVARNETRVVATAKLLVPSIGFYHRRLRRLRIDTEIHGLTFERQQTLPLVIAAMENPHEQVQNALLARIITNVEKLNEAIIVLNRVLQDVNRENMNVELLSQMWENYQRNVLFNLESTDSLEKPI
ncbi:DASH complex subunit Dad4-domain-containing protein [Lipomyces tetrasporus]